jgi:hypothetical protein
MATFKPVENLKEMRESLQDYLLKVVDDTEEGIEESKNSKKIKTYIIESNTPDPRKIENVPAIAKFIPTKVTTLFSVRLEKGREVETGYLDITDPRFWLFHTGMESGLVEGFVHGLILNNHSMLDHSWFSSTFLEEKCSFGKNDGFGLKFRNSFLGKREEGNDRLHYFSMLVWGAKTSSVLPVLRNTTGVASGVTLSRIKQLYETELGYIKETVNYNGKFTLTKGDSIDSYLQSINKIKDAYGQLVGNIEENYRINYVKKDAGFNIQGTYSLIEFENPIENLEMFVKVIISCGEPFRIFGIPKFREKDFVEIYAVDLHTYDKFNMEITPDYIRIFLYKNSCGNVLARLLTNLQQFYDSQIKLIGNDGERIV